MRVKAIERESFDVQITVSQREAGVLLHIFQRIGGPIHRSPRKVTDELSKKLVALGVSHVAPESTGAITFAMSEEEE